MTPLAFLNLLLPLLPSFIEQAPAGEPKMVLHAAQHGLTAIAAAPDAPHVAIAAEQFAEAMLPEVRKHLPLAMARAYDAVSRLVTAIEQTPVDAVVVETVPGSPPDQV
jgi:hypothetical protein